MKPFCEYKYLNLNNFSALELKIKADNSVNKRGYLYRQVVFRFENHSFQKSAVFENCGFWKGAVFENCGFQKGAVFEKCGFQKGAVFEKRGFWKGTVFKRCSFCGFKTTPFKTIWPYFIEYPTDSPQDHMNWFLYCVPIWLLSTPFDLILSLCTQLSPFMNIWPDFIIVYPIDSFQDHLTSFYHCVLNRLLSRPFDLILSFCAQLALFSS